MEAGGHRPLIRVRWGPERCLVQEAGVAYKTGIRDGQIVALGLGSVPLGAIKDWWVEDLGDVIQSAVVAGQWDHKRFQISCVG